jgi:hypothetical protein
MVHERLKNVSTKFSLLLVQDRWRRCEPCRSVRGVGSSEVEGDFMRAQNGAVKLAPHSGGRLQSLLWCP